MNTLSFQLENGKLIWDVIVLFAANINYDAEAGRPRVQCNPNVQYLLDNNETLLQPLRKRGVKVLLGLLGNHDITGLAQLSNQGAKDFAREVAQYCKAYNLDGVNYDDEYSKSPDLSNPSLTTPSTAAAARLCYETKLAMPDKLVTVFAYGQMYGVATVDGVDASEWIDVAVPNYGSSAHPVGNMTKKQCAGIAMEFHLGIGGDLSPSTAHSLINDGYGWYMGFAPSPGKYSSIFRRLTGAETLYGSQIKQPTIFYKRMIRHLTNIRMIFPKNSKCKAFHSDWCFNRYGEIETNKNKNMKAHYKLFLSLALGLFITFAGCQDDEVVDLVKYPVNQPVITIDDAEGASKATLTAVYKSDGTLKLDGPVTRTYTFHFAASPEDATVTFDIINTNIPKENVEISDTKVVLPAGSTDASVTVTLKDEDFSFAASNYDAATYELG